MSIPTATPATPRPGAGFTVTGDGTVVADAGGATSRIPAAGVRLSESLATSHESRASEARTLSRHWSAEAGMARNAAVTDATALVERYSHDVNTGEAYARGVTESESSQAQALESHVEKMSEVAGITKNQTAALVGAAKVGGGWDFIVKIGADGSASWRGQTIESDAWNRIKEYDRQHGVTETWSKCLGRLAPLLDRRPATARSASLNESVSANLTRMRRFDERASLARQESESWSEQAAQVRSDAQSIERELGQPFFAWLSERQGADGRPIGAARRHAHRLAPDAGGCRGAARARRRVHRREVPRSRRAGPGHHRRRVGVRNAARGTLADAYTRETAAAHGGWSEGVRDRAWAAGAPIPGEVEAAALGERAGTKADMMVSEAGREARTGIAQEDVRKGRAGASVQVDKPFEEHATENLPVVGDWLAGKLYGTAKNAVPDGGAGWDGSPGAARARLAGPVSMMGSP